MNFLKIKTIWSNAELGLFKVCVVSVSVLAGAYFRPFILSYRIPILVVFGITTIWTGYLWITKMRIKNQ